MKTLSLLAAAAAAVSLGLAATSGGAATYKPYHGPSTGNPSPPAAVKYLSCQTLIDVTGKSPVISVRVWNNSGVVLTPGMRIYVTYTLKGQTKTTSMMLVKHVQKGGWVEVTVGPNDATAGCTAQVNLLAKSIPNIKPPLPDRPGKRPGPRPH